MAWVDIVRTCIWQVTQQLGPGLWGACHYVHVHQLLLLLLQNRGDVQLLFTCTNLQGAARVWYRRLDADACAEAL
jgi:hypothetical protein